jgi:hypothetical protein
VNWDSRAIADHVLAASVVLQKKESWSQAGLLAICPLLDDDRDPTIMANKSANANRMLLFRGSPFL